MWYIYIFLSFNHNYFSLFYVKYVALHTHLQIYIVEVCFGIRRCNAKHGTCHLKMLYIVQFKPVFNQHIYSFSSCDWSGVSRYLFKKCLLLPVRKFVQLNEQWRIQVWETQVEHRHKNLCLLPFCFLTNLAFSLVLIPATSFLLH